MTERGVQFLKNWIANNVLPTDQGEALTAILATQCILEASSQKILVADMVEKGECVENMIKDAMLQIAEPVAPGE